MAEPIHPQSQSEPLQAEDTDGTSDYGSSLGSSTQTVASSIIDYVYENGRRYHRYAEGKYALPNDETEQDRLDFYHHQQLLMNRGNLHLAPISTEPHNILDCGTGTGIWALDIAESYPTAQVVGIDLSPIQPSWTYPNCKFEVDDLTLDWTFPPDHFDFIHSRQLVMSIKDWPRYVQQMFKHTKPGGWVELAENEVGVHSDDGSLKDTHALMLYFKNFQTAAKKGAFFIPLGTDLVRYMKEAGFVDVNIVTLKQPFAPWAKEPSLKKIGQLSMMVMVERKGIEAYGIGTFTRILGMTETEAQKLCQAACKDIQNRKIHSYNYLWHVYGRKPLPDEL